MAVSDQWQPQPEVQLPQPLEQESQPPQHFLADRRAKSRLSRPTRLVLQHESQQASPQPQLLPQALQQDDWQAGTSFSTQRRTMRQQVTVSQCGTHTRTVRQAWYGTWTGTHTV
jgi:hypothetical protein